MSPPRRRAIGAVRTLASGDICNYARQIRTREVHAHYPRPRGDAARWGHRALPPLHPRQSHAMPAPRAATRCAILHYTREIPALHCLWGLPTPGGAPRRTPFLSAHLASRCRVLGHNDHSNSRFCLKVRKRLGRSLTFVCGIAAHGNHAKKILPRCREAKRKDCVILESLTD